MFRPLVLLLGILLLVACSESETTEQYIQRAIDAMSASEYPAATHELKNALRQDPNSAQARWLLGKVYLDTGDVLSATKELQEARTLGWPPDDIQPAMAQALWAQGEFESVVNLDAKGLTPDAQARLYGLKAQAALALGDELQAEGLIDQALVLKPEDLEVLLAKAKLLASKDNNEDALAIVEKVLASEPQQGDAWSLKAEMLTRQEDYEAALTAFTRAIELKEDDANDLFNRALLYIEMGDYESAGKDARTLLSKRRKHPGSNYLQGRLAYEEGNYDEAIAALSISGPTVEDYPLSVFYLASANLKKGNVDLAVTQAERFHTLNPDSAEGRKVLSVIYLQRGDYADVQRLLQPVLELYPEDVDALDLVSYSLLQEGETSEAIELLARVAKLEADSAEAKVGQRAGLVDVPSDKDIDQTMADISLVLNHVENQDFPAAIAAAEDYRRRYPKTAAAYNLLGRVFQAAGKPGRANKTFQRALARDKSDPGANIYLAQVALEQGDIAAAREFYSAILKGRKESTQAHLQLAALDVREGKKASMVVHLDKAMDANPAALEPRLLLARFYLASDEPGKVAPLFTELAAQQQRAPDVLQVMALAQLATGDTSAAQVSLEKLLKVSGDSAQVRHLMALVATENGDTELALEQLHRALALDENHTDSRLALAKILFAAQESAKFDQQLEKLVAAAPNNADVLLMQAAAAYRAGGVQEAIGFSEKGFKRVPSGGALVALATYLEAAGERDRALEYLSSWLDSNADDISARLAYASMLMSDGQEPQSTTQYAIILQAAPDNLTALNNQAWILREKDTARALEYARRAAALSPDSAAVLDTLAVVEYSNGDYEQAQGHILRGLRAAPEDPSMLYHSAMIAAALNDKAAARSTLKELLATNENFPELAEARALLTRLED